MDPVPGKTGASEQHDSRGGPRLVVVVCLGPTCGDQLGSRPLFPLLVQAIRDRQLEDRVHVTRETCFGHCQKGPNVLVCPVPDVPEEPDLRLISTAAPGAVLYHQMTQADVATLATRHLQHGQLARTLLDRPLRHGVTASAGGGDKKSDQESDKEAGSDSLEVAAKVDLS